MVTSPDKMSEWKKYKLNDICDYVSSHTTDSGNYISTENMLPNKGGVTESSVIPTGAVVEYRVGDVLISNIRPYFQKIWYADRNGGCSPDVLCIRAKENTDSKYLYYLLSQQAFFDFMMSGAKGCKMPRGDKKQIMQWEVSLPPMEEQKRIAGILSALDDKIELNRRINANLELQAQTLFNHWFVDFEFPNADGKPYKSSGGKLIDSPLGPIPEGWKTGVVNDIIYIQSGFAFKSEDFVDTGKYRLVTIKNVQDGNMDIAGAVYIDDVPYKMPSYCMLRYGDILLSLTGNVGRCCMVDRQDLLLNQRVAKLQPINKDDMLFTYVMFRNETFKNRMISIARGTAQMNLSPIETGQLQIIIPDDVTLKRFGEYGTPIYQSLLNNRQENIRLANLRDTILPKLIRN